MHDVDDVYKGSRTKHHGFKRNVQKAFIDKKHEEDKKNGRPNHGFKDERGEVAGTVLFAGIPWRPQTKRCPAQGIADSNQLI